MADSLSLFGPAEFQEETPLEAVSPNMSMQFDPEADIKDIVPAVQGNLDQLGSNDVSILSADVAPNPLINSRELTHGMDPVRTSKVLTLSRESGLPPRVVEQHVDEMERRRTISDEKLDLIQNQYPQTAQLLSDPDFFAVAQDDIDRLIALEGTIRQYNPGVWERIGTKWEESRQQLEDGVRGFALGALSSYVQLADEEEAGGFVPNAGVKALRELAREALVHVQAKHDAEKGSRTAPLMPADSMIQQYVEDFVGASAPILATMGISAFGSPYAGAAFMATQIAGGDYLARKEQGASDVAAFGSGLADAAMQAPLEALSLGKFFNIFKATGGAQILKTVATALGTEFTTEFLQKFPEDLTEDLALMDVRGQDVWDALGGFMDNLPETTKAGLYEGLLSAPWALLGGAGQVVRDYSNLRATEQEQTILDSLTQDIAQTNLAQLDPVLHQQALQILASGSQIENVFIDSQAFEAAYGQDVAGQTQVLNSLGISQEAYQNAVATGEELTVQLGNYASTVAAFPEFANKLANDRKLSKQGLTRNEWMQTQQELAKTYRDILIQAQEEVQAATQEDAESKAIYEQVYAARQAAGRVPDAARLDAAQFTAALVSMAKMSEGKYTPTQLFEAYMPQVTAGQNAPTTPTLQQEGSSFSRVQEARDAVSSWREITPGDMVSGLTVRENIDNYGSIEASLDDFEVVGLREVPMSLFNVAPGERELASRIQESGEMSPLIVVVDGHTDGIAYILEGSHRIDAAAAMGLESIPALVVVDNESMASGDLYQQALQQDAAYAGAENQAEIEEAARLWAEMGTESPYFKRWSGGAPVVLKNAAPSFTTGQAVVVEADHGAPDIRFVQEDGVFKSEKERYGFGRSEAAHWFTRDTATAKTYADPRRAFDYQNAEPGVVSAYVRLDNPLVIDAAGQNWRDAQKRGKTSDVIAEARANGHDGVIIYNVKDDYNNDKKTRPTTTLTVFSSTQIKSATGNRGTFDPADARIQYQSLSPEAQAMADRIAQALNQQVGPEPDAEVAVSPTLYQVQNLPEWSAKTRAWMEKNGYTAKEIEKHLGAIEGQMRIFAALGPMELEMLPKGAKLAKKYTKNGVPYEGPLRENVDPIYKITFDASAMCVKRLEAAATANYIQAQIGRALTASERMALVALFRSAGKAAPCVYCYVEAPRAKSSEFVKTATDVIFGLRDTPKHTEGKKKGQEKWAESTVAEARAAREEFQSLGLSQTDVDPNVILDPEYAQTGEAKAKEAAAPAIYGFMRTQMLNAKANLPKLYEEYSGQILDLPQELLDELNGYAGLRFFSSSDFQAEHVADLMQAVFDMEVRGAKAHAYTKVPDFVRIFGGTGIKIQTSVFAKEENGQVVMDDWQGMNWDEAKAFREQYDNVGTVLVATSDNIVQWALEQDWIDYIIPFHWSGLEKKFYKTLDWQDFTSTQTEQPIAKGGKAQKIRMYETGSAAGISNEKGTRNYLTLAMKRKMTPVFPAFLFKDFKPTGDRAADARNARIRWELMVKGGKIDWDQINPNYYKLRKDYARTDTPFKAVQANVDVDMAEEILNKFLAGETPRAQVDPMIAERLMGMIRESETTGADIGVDALKRVKEGQTLFQAAYHGSPYKFSKFSLEHMGKGEGAQAYGWGLYFASRKEIADWYREKLADNDIHSGQVVIDGEQMDWKDAVDRFFPDPVANKTWKKIGENKAARHSGSYQMFMRADLMPAIREEMGLSKEEYGRVDFPNNPGQLYKVEIPEDDVMLLWDSPLSEQPEKVREALEKIEEDLGWSGSDLKAPTGRDLYRHIEAMVSIQGLAGDRMGGAAQTVSETFNDYGIKGIKFLDGSSRAQGEGSYNYVIFDDSTIDILETFYQFAGQRAETADKFQLGSAQSRIAAGEDAESVRKETGWFQGKDGKWRFEINDSNAVLTRKKDGSTVVDFFFPGNFAGAKLFYLLEHPALFAAYPWVEDIKVTSSPVLTERGKMAAFDPYKNEIFVSDKLDFSEEKFLPLLLHEIQHAIQKREGFAAGGDAADPNYRKISGEIEARNVEARLKMTDDERRSISPGTTQDVPDSDALVVFNGGESFSAPEALMRQNQAEPQAAFTFKTKSGRPLIELFRTANQSSFLHETGHLYLEMVRELALQENAPAPVTALWTQTKAALKIDDGPISREAHEEWARNLEAYFLEGAAPSLGLRKIFAQYAQWLRSIYKQVQTIFAQSGTQFNEDLKPIFDRIFASEKDIEEARSFYASQKPFFAAADPKVMAKERQKYEERRLRARESMEDKRLRQLTDAWVKVNGGRAKIRAEVTEEVKARPVVAVLAALSSGGAGSIKNENLVSALREDPIDPAEYVWVFGTDWAASDSDAVRAAIQEIEDISGRVSAAAAERDSKLEEYEAVIGRIRKLGGIRADTVKESLGKDLAEDIRKKFGTGIVTKDGMPLDEVAMVLQERAGGYGFDGYPETVIDYLSSPYSLTKTQINKDFSDISSSAKARIKELETLVSNDATRKKAKEDEAAALREVPSGVFKKGGKLPGEVAKKLGFETTSELYSALREYQAQRDTKSFNMKALDASVGEDLRKKLKAVDRYSSLVKKEGTVDPDILAAENGYDSAVAMVEDMLAFPGEKAAITAGVEARMESERQRIARGLAETDLAADEAYHNDDQLAVLVAEFEILSQQAAQKVKRLEAAMVRDVAKQLLASEKVNFATQSSRFARLERRAAKLARAAYERGDAKAAAEYKRQEVLNHAMFIESVALKEGVAKTAARIKRGIQKTKGISPEVKTLLQGLGIQYGILPYKKERDPVRAFEMWNQDLVAKGGKIPTIEGWVDEMRKLGISAPLDPFLNNAAAVGYKDITVGQFRALEEGVRILRRVDRGLHTVTWIDGSTITMEDAIERLQAHVAGRGGKAPDPLTYDPNAVTLAARNFFAEHTKTSTIIQALDNWEAGGLFYQLIYRPVMDADSDLSARWATEAPKIKALFEPIRRQLREKVVVLGKARPRAQLVAMALNIGNAGNRERLMAGLGITEAQLGQLLAPLTTEEMDFVQAVWDYIATFKDEAFAVERRLTGREPAAVDPVPFEFKGKTYAGGYYPVSYDKNLRDQKGEARDAKEALDELFGGTPAGTAMTAHGHLEARASAGTGERLSQELSVISDHVAQVLRDITHREAVVNVAKLLKNKQIMAMITDVVGREKAKQLWPWLVSVSKEGREQIQLTAVEKMLLHFRPAMTFYTQAYKVGTALMQAAGFLQVFEFVQAKHVGQAVWQLYGKGLLSLNMFSDGEIISHPLIKEIREKSPQMNERLLNADRDIRDATKEFSTSESALATYKKAGFKATVAMQFYVADVVAWQGAYLQALTDGMTEKDAVNRADFVVEQAMGAGYTRALSKIQRGGSIQRFLTMFYTFGNVLYNLAARRAGIMKKQLASGQYGAAALGASSFLVLQWVMPVLLEALVRGDVADDDDDEALIEKLLVNLLTYPAQSVLIARELSGIAKGFKYRFSPALKPFESVGQWISSVARAIEQEDAGIAAKPTAQLVGTTTGLIPAQFINSGEVLTDYLAGEDQELSVKELLYGKGGRK